MIKKQLYRMRWKGFQLKKRITDILCDEKGIGVVEVILILVVLIAIGLGMLLACLIPKCVFLIGMGFVGLGVWLISQNRRC